MSDEQQSAPEDQSQRWLKYGSNTVLVSIVVVLLAAAVVFLAQRKDKRYDTTAAALYTLKPQTLKVIGDNDQPITITSFYSKAKRTDATYGTATAAADADASAALDRQADVVADLLAEYASRGKNITVETIDPKLQPSKADALIEQVTDQYGGEVKAYKAFTDSLKAKFADINAPAKAEAAKVDPLRKQLPDTPQMDDTARMLLYVGRIPTLLDRAQKAYERLLGQKPPDYKAVTSSVTTAADNLSGDLSSILEQFKAIKEAPATGPSALPQPLRDYAASATPTYEKIKAQLDALSKEAKGLGELKLDTIREALHQDNAILVRGKSDWKVIRYDQVWKNDNRDVRAAAAGRGASTIHPRFAGEQMVTTAILALQHPTKQKVCFVRAGGQPLASVGGLFSSVGDRLRDYNFDVSDKDVTGQSQMQSMQMQQPPPPEPTDAEIDDALWVVLPIEQQQQRNPMMGGPTPPGQIADKVAAHVKSGHHIGPDGKRADGGSVFVFAIGGSGGPGGGGGDPLTAALDPFGVKVRPEVTAVHALVKTADAADTGDEINRVLKLPQVFALTDWGHSPMTDTLAGLPGVLLNAVPVEANPTRPAAGRPPRCSCPCPARPTTRRAGARPTRSRSARRAPARRSTPPRTCPPRSWPPPPASGRAGPGPSSSARPPRSRGPTSTTPAARSSTTRTTSCTPAASSRHASRQRRVLHERHVLAHPPGADDRHQPGRHDRRPHRPDEPRRGRVLALRLPARRPARPGPGRRGRGVPVPSGLRRKPALSGTGIPACHGRAYPSPVLAQRPLSIRRLCPADRP